MIQILKPRYCDECKKKLGIFDTVYELEIYKSGKKIDHRILCKKCYFKWSTDFYGVDASEERSCGNCYWCKGFWSDEDMTLKYYCAKRKEWLEPETTCPRCGATEYKEIT